MTSIQPYNYPGTELDLFQEARNWKSYFAQLISPHLGDSVLEVGAGIGGSTNVLGKNNSVKRWLCLEPDQNLLSELAIKIRELGPAFEARQGTVNHLPDDEKFDSILYLDVLEHIEKDDAELKLALEHLNPGGHIIILVPAHNSLFSPLDTASGHFRRYNRNTLKRVIPSSLKQRDLLYLDSIGFFLSLANRHLFKQTQPTKHQIKFWDNMVVPISRILDPMLHHRLGKSLLGIWQIE